MSKKHLKTPEEVIKVLKEGEKMKTKKKRCAIICAEVVKQQGYNSWDVGRIQLMEDMYEACLNAKRIKKRDKHPLNRMKRISKILLEDTKRADGVWCCNKQLTYPGIIKKPVNFYELRG